MRQAIVCDPGTGYIKIGYSGESYPSACFPALVGRPMLRAEQLPEEVAIKDIMVGDETSKYRNILQLTYPTSEAVVKNWEDYELLLDYSFGRIGAKPVKGADIFLTEAVGNPVVNREKMLQLMFEKFEFGRVQIGVQALLSIFAAGSDSGMLIDSGDGVTHCVPVFKMHVLKNNVERLNIAGQNITKFLAKLLLRRGYAFNGTADFELIRELKEKYCFVSLDFKADTRLADQTTCFEKEHILPDKTRIKIGRERFQAPEVLFEPAVNGHEFVGAAQMIFGAINRCDMDCRVAMYENIILSGGTTVIPGFPSRLEADIRKLYKAKVLKGVGEIKINIGLNDSPARRYSVFQGASHLANLTQKSDRSWFTKAQYEEKGTRLAYENQVFQL